MLTELQRFGLSDKEARVYLASLELGPATADRLAKQAKVNRSTTYVQVESLMNMGLMSTYEEGKKTFFAPESPTHLKRILQEKRQETDAHLKELEKMLPELSHTFEGAGDRPVVRFFTGKEGIVSLREEALNAKDKKLYVISSNDALARVFSRKERDAFSEKRTQKGIVTKLLYTREEGKLTDVPALNTKNGYLKPGTVTLATDIVIFDDAVGIMTLKGKLIGILIRSREISESMRSIFNLLWAQAEKH